MAWTIPDKGQGVNDIQSIAFRDDLEAAVSDVFSNYVKYGGVVAPSTALSVTVSKVAAYSLGVRYVGAAGVTVTHVAADLTNPRIDLICVAAGVTLIRQGVAAVQPKPAARQIGDVPLAYVLIPANLATLTAAHIVDKRIIVPNWGAYYTEHTDYINRIAFSPISGVSGGGNTDGTTWTPAGTVNHPTPTPSRVGQMYRTRYANVVTTTNQVLGVIQTTAGLPMFWRGNATDVGGFYFRCKFIVELIPATSIRLFVGLTSLATAVVAADATTGDCVGLSHITTDALNILNFVVRNNVTTTSVPITLFASLAAGQGFEFIMYCKPNDTVIYYRLIELASGAAIVDTFYNVAANLPTAAAFMGAQCAMSNGANAVVTTVALGINELIVTTPAVRS